MEDPVRSELREYAWQYFALHADQRLKTFNFYLTLYAFAFGGLIVMVKDAKSASLGALAGLVLALLSYVFWKFDGRNKELVEVSQDALRQIEADDSRVNDNNGTPHATRLFTTERIRTNALKSSRPLRWSNPVSWFAAHYTYTRCFNVLFLVFGVAGLLLAIYFLASMFWALPLMAHAVE
jgi:VIT1/CCC1 family predicted Fe2+/Mn2+ transporter